MNVKILQIITESTGMQASYYVDGDAGPYGYKQVVVWAVVDCNDGVSSSIEVIGMVCDADSPNLVFAHELQDMTFKSYGHFSGEKEEWRDNEPDKVLRGTS